jgi:hypothetical protein
VTNSRFYKAAASISVNCVETTWQRAESSATANCVDWRKATSCASSESVHVAAEGDLVYLRDSKDPDGPQIAYTEAEYDEGRGVGFRAVSAQEVPPELRSLRSDAGRWYAVSHGGTRQFYDYAEMAAFQEGVATGRWVPVGA